MARTTTLMRAGATTILALLLMTVMPLLAQQAAHANHDAPAKLVVRVRQATQQFLNVNNARAAGYAPAFGCVTGPDHGAMGIHYVNGTLVGDGKIDPEYPEALIYEPDGNRRRL